MTSAFRLYCSNFSKKTKFLTLATSKKFKTCIETDGKSEGGPVGVLNSKYGYPVHWNHWKQLLDPKNSIGIFTRLKLNKTFAVHLWNKIAKGNFDSIGLTPNTPYAQLLTTHCPLIYTHIL